MTQTQKVIKYCAIALAICLIVGIFSGIIQALAALTAVFGSDGDVGDMQTYDVAEPVRNLEIEISAAELTIRTGETLSVESNCKKLRVDADEGTLEIRDKSRRSVRQNAATIVLTVPADLIFDRVDIETGAGRVHIEGLSADKLELDLGAGETTIADLTANEEAEINGGAGQLTVSRSVLRDLNLDMGVGAVEMEVRLLGDSKFDLGIGKTDVTLLGTKDDYRVSVSKGIGAASVDGESVSDGAVVGNGGARVEINGGIGEVIVSYAEED